MTPRVIVHGGAGRAFRDPSRAQVARESLRSVCAEIFELLNGGASAGDAVRRGCERLESDPNFNAGLGSAIQRDGAIRMSAGFMEGARQAFSGVINVEAVEHPIAMAVALNDQPDRVIAAQGAALLARSMGLPVFDPSTPRRVSEWVDERSRGFVNEPAEVTASDFRMGTVGVVALDSAGNIVAGTSTGGRGFERLGRVSDSATPAGNYATSLAGISCTGIGEDILDEGLAVRIAVRVEDGLDLEHAMSRSIEESAQRGRVLGAIAVSRDGQVVWGKTSDILLAAWASDEGMGDSVDAPLGVLIERVGG